MADKLGYNRAMQTMRFEDVPREWLRAWVDAGIIEVSVYVAEVERREKLKKLGTSDDAGGKR